MSEETKIKLFQNQEVRIKWDEKQKNTIFLFFLLLEFLAGVKILHDIGEH